MPVHTLAQIAASYGVQPMELATLVGVHSIDPHAALTDEQTASIIRVADDTSSLATRSLVAIDSCEIRLISDRSWDAFRRAGRVSQKRPV